MPFCQERKLSFSFAVASLLCLDLLAGATAFFFCDRNPLVETTSNLSFLPAKWFDDGGGFLDGTGEVRNALIDPATGNPAPRFQIRDQYFDSSAVLGSISTHSKLVNGLSAEVKAYGRGGALTLAPKARNSPAKLNSSRFVYESTKSYSLDLLFDEEATQKLGNAPFWNLSLIADYNGDGRDDETLSLIFFSDDYSAVLISESAFKDPILSSSLFQGASVQSFSAYLQVQVQQVAAGPLPMLFLKSIGFDNGAADLPADVKALNWADATLLMAGTPSWTGNEDSAIDLFGSRLIFGDFHYDFYRGAFGREDDGFREAEFSEAEIDDFIARGWLSYSWQRKAANQVGDFAILDSLHCPLRSVTREARTGNLSSLIGLKSPYRYFFYRGWIGECAPQKYYFGTNEQGEDFAKIVALSFLISTGLGLGAIGLALLWGASFRQGLSCRGSPSPSERSRLEAGFLLLGIDVVFSSIFALLSPGICAYLLLFTLVGGFFVSLASPGGLRFDSSSFGAFSRRKNGRLEPFFLAPFLLPISLCSETLFAPFFFLDFGVPRFSLGLALAAAQKEVAINPAPFLSAFSVLLLGTSLYSFWCFSLRKWKKGSR